jgi:cobyrinic acid a,c-diamide synthase
MIFLSEQLTTTDGITHAMVGVLPFAMEMTAKLVQFGYVTVELTRDSLIGPAGTIVRGHSFHHSRIVNEAQVPTAYSVTYSLSGKQEREGYRVGNVLASYIHLHFRAAPSIAEHFVRAARTAQVTSKVPA